MLQISRRAIPQQAGSKEVDLETTAVTNDLAGSTRRPLQIVLVQMRGKPEPAVREAHQRAAHILHVDVQATEVPANREHGFGQTEEPIQVVHLMDL